MPRFSIVVPVYNVAPYLRACLNSLCIAVEKFLQLGDGTVEIICVDDGSTDGGGAMLDKYAADKQYIMVIHQDNKGIGPTRNVGMDVAKGEWLLFVDSDDEVVPDYLLVLDKIIKQHSPDAIRFGHKNVSVLGEISQDITDIEVRVADADKKPQAVFNAMNSAFVWNTCYRRKITEGIRYVNIPLGEDVLFSCQMLPKVNRVATTKAPIYHYLQREESLAHKKVISVKQIESCGISTLGRMRSIKKWCKFGAVQSLAYKLLRTTYVGNVGMYLERVGCRDDMEAWHTYCKYGRDLYADREDYIPYLVRVVGGVVFKTGWRFLWRLVMYWPQCIRARLITFRLVRAFRDRVRRIDNKRQ